MRVLRVSRREDGAVAVMVAIFSVVLLVVAAFTTDFGMAYVQRRALATGADSAALAVVRAEYKYQTAHPTRTCATIVSTDAASASGIAQSQVDANAPFNATTGTAVTTTLSCDNTAKVLLVTVVVNRTVNRILGGLVGASAMQIGRQAVSGLGVYNSVSGLSPIGLCTDVAQAIRDDHVLDVAAGVQDRAVLVKFDKVTASACTGSGGHGNWGWLTFPGQGNGASALGAMIASGYSGTFTLNPTSPPSYTMDGTPGNKGNSNPAHDGMQQIMGTSVTFPVYSTYAESGSNVTYTVVGFLSVKLCGYDDSVFPIPFPGCYDSTVPMAANDMQVRYVDFIPAADFGKICDIGAGCANNAYTYKLLN